MSKKSKHWNMFSCQTWLINMLISCVHNSKYVSYHTNLNVSVSCGCNTQSFKKKLIKSLFRNVFSLFFDCSLHLSLLPSQQVGEGFLCNARFWSFLQENTSKQHFFLSWAQISVSTDVHVYGQKVPALKCFYFFSLNSLVSSSKCSKIRQHKPSHKSSHLK